MNPPVSTNDGFVLDNLNPKDFEDLSVDLGGDGLAPPVKSLRDELLAESMKQMREARAEHRAAAIAGHEAIKRLVIACGHKSGQSRTVRAALYSLWNGGARSLRECVTGIDWAIHRDLCAVMLGFGFDGNEAVPSLWDDAIRKPFEAAGLWDWFLEDADLNEGGAL